MKLIIDMQMPNNCSECPLAQFDYGRFCGWVVHCKNGMKSVEREIADNGRPDWCPIVGALPNEHGDLVDYDEVEKEFNRLLTYMEEVPDENGIIWFRRETIIPRGYTMKFHTIIPAERRKDE